MARTRRRFRVCRAAPAPLHWLPYFLYRTGAKVYVAPTSMEGVGRWSMVADPEGAVFALFQSAH